ncbi:MAG: molybdopterin-dependent oxidoreductase [Armatimonadetes bacterium]|nr:molybdopterin-dependent oxidoreductase [Armatimonadota bacterium]
MFGNVSRRDFLKVAGIGTAGSLALGAGSWALGRIPQRRASGHGGSTTVVPTFCEMCFWKCGTLAHVRDGEIVKLLGNPADPLCEGRLCPRGTGGLGAVYDPDRLASPLVRVRTNGSEKWEAVGWDRALDEVASRLQAVKEKYGPESLALFSHGTGGAFFGHLVSSFGSPNIAQPSFAQCRGPRDVGFELTFGEGIGSPERYDLANAKMAVLIGSHLGENMHNTQVQEFADAIGKGLHLVVADPRFSVAASKAEHWLPVKPGTDLALLLAWIHVIVEEGLYDRPFVEANTVGFSELKREVAGYTPEWAYPHTGIPAETIRLIAREMGAHSPSVLVYPGRHVTWYGDDTQRSRAIALLSALLGSWGRPGGFYFPTKAKVGKYPVPPYPEPARGRADGGGSRFPYANEGVANGLRDATRTGRPYPVKAWMVYGTNLIQALPNVSETEEALKALDFMVAIDTMPAEITGWADVVLPECTYLERFDELWTPSFRTPMISLRQPVVDPLFDSKPGWWIARELGLRLGLETYFPWNDIEDYLDTRLRTAGTTLAELKAVGTLRKPGHGLYAEEGRPMAFGTKSGKVELYSEELKKAGHDPVPKYTPPDPAPEGHFRLLYGRSPVHTFGRTTNNRRLAELEPENEVWVNTDTALDLGVKDGERVVLVNQDGARSNPIKAKVTERIRPECVYMVHGFGHTDRRLRQSAGKGADDTGLITRYKVDPLMGGTAMRGNFVRIERQEA